MTDKLICILISKKFIFSYIFITFVMALFNVFNFNEVDGSEFSISFIFTAYGITSFLLYFFIFLFVINLSNRK